MSAPTHVYIVGYSDHVVKVGRTGNPEQRMKTLAAQAKKRGAEITATYVLPHADPIQAENGLRITGRLHKVKAWGDEYFYGEFDEFLALVRWQFPRLGYAFDTPYTPPTEQEIVDSLSAHMFGPVAA